MSKYVFVLRKKDIEIELSAPDKDFVEKQMSNWQESIISSLSPAKSSIPKEKYIPSISKNPSITKIVQNETPDISKEPVINTAHLVDNLEKITPKGAIITEPDIATQIIHDTLPSKEDISADRMIDPTEEAIRQIEKTIENNNTILEQVNADLPEELEETLVDITESPPVIPKNEEIIENIALNADEISKELAEEQDIVSEDFEILEIPTEVVVKKQQSENISQSLDFVEAVDEEVLSEVELQSISTEEDKASDEEFEDLIAAMSAEVEQESMQQPQLLENIQQDNVPEILNNQEKIPMVEPDTELSPEIETELISNIETIIEEDQPEEDQIEGLPSVDMSKKSLLMTIEEFISTISIKTPVDVLLGAAFYMEKFENMNKFTTKDISARTVKAIKKPISPNIVLACVNKGYIEVVPDFTGTAESNEYTLTEQGKQYILNQLS